MEMLKKNAIMLILLLALIGGGIYWYGFRQSPTDEDPGVGVSNQESKYADVRREILHTIKTLRAVKLDVTILDDAAFRALVAPVAQPADTRPVSRDNPFRR